jgi:tRNA threonylcarbamoyladenosine biosynthesis protein TsaB
VTDLPMTIPPAGPLLALDTSTGVGSVALGRGGELLVERVFTTGATASSMLLPAIDAALREAGIARSELAGVVTTSGPGSFTGLRIGAATAKGIVHALSLPLWAYSGLLASAAAGWSAARPVCALFDARRRDVYVACYRFAKGIDTLLAPTALALDEVIETFRGTAEAPLFTGDGAWRHAAELEHELPGATVLPAPLGAPRASALLALAHAAPALGRVADPLAWEPEYVRAAGAERIAAARASAGGG